MKKIITIGGSTSKESINKKLAESVGQLLKGVEVINLDLNNYELPIFSEDIEKDQGFSNDLQLLNKEIEDSDGIILSLAEHNGAYAAAFKNAFDWLSRINGKVWRNKPMLLLSTSNGTRGGQSVMDIALSRFPYNGGNIIGSMTFPSFDQNFQDGQIVSEELLLRITQLSDRFIKSL
ncbi:MAG: NAD(P)H-dependent oxidoreductase [Flavobacteriales bacterium]|nr:NAD(P)H-dependent oxidoreductase [Flavobacteriales bacterium]